MNSHYANHYDVIIIGGGVIGAAVFHQLSTVKNSKVLLIEKSRFGHGSTGWSGGLVRAFHADVKLRAMALESQAYYRDFEKQTSSVCTYQRSGFLYFTYPENEFLVQQEIETLPNTYWLAKRAAATQFPHIIWDDLAGAAFEPEAGFMNTLAVTRAWIRAGRANHGHALEGVRFDKLLTQAAAVIGMQTNCGNYYAPRIILCTGAWTEQVNQQAHLQLSVKVDAKSIQLNRYQVLEDMTNHPAYVDPVSGLYGRASNNHEMLLGSPVPEWDINPDITQAPDAGYTKLCTYLAAQRFKWIQGAKVIGGYRRFDGYTSDERGVIGASEEFAGLYWATGFSGGGFKLAPAVAARTQLLLTDTAMTAVTH